MKPQNWDCPIKGCDWAPDYSNTEEKLRVRFMRHLESDHNLRVVPEIVIPPREIEMEKAATVLVLQLEQELDRYVKTAMEWVNPYAETAQQNVEEYLSEEIKKTRETAIGRGIAIAMMLAYTNLSVPKPFASADEIIAAAVERYQTRQANTAAHNAGEVPQPEAPAPDPEVVRAATEEWKKDAAPAPKVSRWSPEQCAKITGALNAGIHPKELAGTFGATVEEILAAAGQ